MYPAARRSLPLEEVEVGVEGESPCVGGPEEPLTVACFGDVPDQALPAAVELQLIGGEPACTQGRMHAGVRQMHATISMDGATGWARRGNSVR